MWLCGGQEHPKAVAEWLFAPRRAAPKNGANVSCGYGANVTDAIDLIGRAAISDYRSTSCQSGQRER